MKICSKCKIEKDDLLFSKNQSWCNDCKKKYREENKAQIVEQRQKYYQENKDQIKENSKEFYQENKESLQIYKKNYYFENRDQIRAQQKEYYQENDEQIKEHQREYYQENKDQINDYRLENQEQIKIYRNEYERDRKKNDPVYKLRGITSIAINKMLKTRGTSKNGHSILQYLPYSFEKLKQHLESQFESWMTWNNWGIYNSETWDDNDSRTWTWQIDHIIPHSTFEYTSMDCQEFRDCWALSNLRPLSAKQNIIDGVNRTRHSVI